MKPCPFCGKADKEMVIIQEPPMGGYGDETVVYAVRCEWCGCRGPEGSTEEKAIVAWEERP